MFNVKRASGSLSQIALRMGIGSLVAAILLALCEGYLRGPLGLGDHERSFTTAAWIAMAANSCYSLRNIAESVIEAAAIVFIGAKFLEVRSVLNVGFDKIDADKVTINGPDDSNIVWIGRRYDTKLEAQSVVAALESRLRDAAGAAQ